ncbi:unnamed protein product [Lymnaea stagnalis]|uniref:Uncharacterized protein n=1 Tax=Lymnaea stagnalis TaxID=6523 RepID=A0AAV2HZY5_LYMST
MGPGSCCPCITLLTALVSLTSALGMFTKPSDADGRRYDVLDILVHHLNDVEGQGPTLQEVLREAFLSQPVGLVYDEDNSDLDSPSGHSDTFDDQYRTILDLVTQDDRSDPLHGQDDTVKRGSVSELNVGHPSSRKTIQAHRPKEILFVNDPLTRPEERQTIRAAKISKPKPTVKPRHQKLKSCPVKADGSKPIMCPKGKICVEDQQICDGHKDCLDGEDESFTLCVVKRLFENWTQKMQCQESNSPAN